MSSNPFERRPAPLPTVEPDGRSRLCWRVDMTIHAPSGARYPNHQARALGRGVRFEPIGTQCHVGFSVSADDVAIAARVALGRWTHLVEELGLDDSEVVELHLSRVGGPEGHLPPVMVALADG